MRSPERRRAHVSWRASLLALAALLAPAAVARAQSGPPPIFVAAAGQLGLRPSDEHVGVLDLELRGRPMAATGVLRIEPVVGALGTTEGSLYARAGFARAFPFAGRWDATIVEAAGVYHAGNGKRLGSTVEFRSAIELGCRVGTRTRVALALSHLSNASIADHNPGVEALTISVGWLDPFAARR